jgi:hypothetical protein
MFDSQSLKEKLEGFGYDKIHLSFYENVLFLPKTLKKEKVF